jgi:hypothetical protein
VVCGFGEGPRAGKRTEEAIPASISVVALPVLIPDSASMLLSHICAVKFSILSGWWRLAKASFGVAGSRSCWAEAIMKC